MAIRRNRKTGKGTKSRGQRGVGRGIEQLEARNLLAASGLSSGLDAWEEGAGLMSAEGLFGPLNSTSTGQVVPLGPEFRVNTTTSGNQERSDVATDAVGNYVVTWGGNGPGDTSGVFAQRYNAAGAPQGDEFRVNTYTTDHQWTPEVAMDADGDFVITWSGTGQDDSYGIFAQRYNAVGAPQGGEFKVNTYTTNGQYAPSVAMDADGDFVIAWHGDGPNGNSWDIYAQRYSATGNTQGTAFKVNSWTTGGQYRPSVAMDSDGDFVITWDGSGQDDSYGIFAQQYNAAGVAQGTEFKVNSWNTGGQYSPAVAMDVDGDFVVTWSSSDGQNPNLTFDVIFARRYNAGGVAQGSEFMVNTYTADSQHSPVVAMDADGDFVVAWTSNGQDGSIFGIYGQHFNAVGVAQGDEFHVTTYTTNSQHYPSVAMDADGDFLITWNSGGQDGSSYGIYAQRFGRPPVPSGVYAAGVLNEVLENERLVETLPQLIVAFDEELSIVGGTSGTDSVLNPANWQLTRHGVDISSQISGISFAYEATRSRWEAVVSFSTPLTNGEYVLTLRDTVRDLSEHQLDGDNDGVGGGDFARNFRVAVPIAVGPELPVNTTTSGNQYFNPSGGSTVASDALGNYVITWYGNGPGDTYGVFGQRYDANGMKLGNEFLVNNHTTNEQSSPAVAMDADGDFVITWMSLDQDGWGWGIYARRYNSAGVAQGNEFRVSDQTWGNQMYASVAMDAEGDFVIAWNGGGPGDDYGIFARRYSAAGVAQEFTEFKVNDPTAGVQNYPSISMDAEGDFVVVWQGNGPLDSEGIFARRYNAAGVAQAPQFKVNDYVTGVQNAPSVALDADGDFLISWTSVSHVGGGNWDVYAQRYNAIGERQGDDQFRVNAYTTHDQNVPSVAMDADGDFVITWYSYGQDLNAWGVYAQRYNAAGTPQHAAEFKVNSFTTGNQLYQDIAMDADGDFVIAWVSTGQDGSGFGVYAQRFGYDFVPPVATGVYVAGGLNEVLENERLVETLPQLIVVFDEELSVAGGSSGADSVLNPANWQLTRFGYDLSSRISGVSFGYESTRARWEAVVTFTAPLTNGEYILTLRDAVRDVSGNQLDGDDNGTAAGDFVRNFTVALPVAVGGEVRVNTTTSGNQIWGSVATDAQGNYVITWGSSGQDGDGSGIYAQRYNAAGAAQGNEFKVNTYTTSDQHTPAVAMDADGDFVIAWVSANQDGSDLGVYAQRYNSAGVLQGSEFKVNTYTTSNQYSPSVAMDADGDFIVTWMSTNDDGNDSGIYGQRYNAAGTAQGSEFRVGTYTAFWQLPPSVAMNADGDFIVAWNSNGQDGSGWGVYAQRYNAAGTAQGSEFLVNTYTANNQVYPSVAMDAEGNFIIAWQSAANSVTGVIFAQRYNAAGMAQGSEFQVNTYTDGYQKSASVAMDADGDFVITWHSYGQDGSDLGVYAQRYNSAGVLQGSEFKVNTYTASDQYHPSVAMDADGDFIVTWNSNGQDGSGWGVYAQRYAFASGPSTSGLANVTVLEDASGQPVDLWGAFADDDDPDSSLVFTITGDTNPGLTTQSISNVSGSLWLNFVADQFGTTDLTVRATDTSGQFVETALTVIVNPVNDQPSFTAGANQQIAGSALTAQSVAGWGTAISAGPANEAAQTLNFEVEVLAGEALFDVLPTIDGVTGTLAYTPVATANGAAILRIRLHDNGGTANGGSDTSGWQTFVITMNGAPAVRTGSEIEISPTATGDQLTRVESAGSVAMAHDGSFVIVWTGVDSSGSGIFYQRFAADGTRIGTAQFANTTQSADQQFAAVATDKDGNFVITWESANQDGDGWGVYGRYFAANATPLTSEFIISQTTIADQLSPSVAMDLAGNFVVAWQSGGVDGDNPEVFARRFNADGIALGNEFAVNTYTPGRQQTPSVAMDADGDFVVAWQSYGQDGDGWGIFARRFDSLGNALGGEFAVNHLHTLSFQQTPSVAMDATGEMLFTWTSDNGDGDGSAIMARRFDRQGVAAGDEFQVNTTTSGDQLFSSVAMDADGDAVIAWSSLEAGSFEVFAQRFERLLSTPVGGEFLINSYTTGDQYFPSVAMDSDGDFVIAWTSDSQDGDGLGVYAQLFGDNQAPTTTGLADVNVDEDAADVLADLWAPFDDTTDSDQQLTYTVTGNTNGSLVSTVVDSQTGKLVLNFAADASGTAELTVRATDTNGLTVETSFTVNVAPVNDDPVADDQTINLLEDQPASGTLTGSDIDSANLTYVEVSAATKGTFVITDPATGAFTYTPYANANGTDSFTFQITDDDNGESNVATVTINITPVNDVPVFNVGADQTVDEDSGPHVAAGWATDISAGPTDESSQVLSFLITENSNPGLFAVEPSIDPVTGNLSYTLAPNAFGSATISVILTDDGGTANGGQNSSTAQSFTVSVQAVNDAPSFTPGEDITVAEDAGLVELADWATDIIAGPVNENGQTLSFLIVDNSNPGLFASPPAINAAGQLTFTSAPDAFGTATIHVVLADNGGTANGGVDTSVEHTFMITVTPVNDDPVADDQTVNLLEDEPASGTLTGSDIDSTNLTFAEVSAATKGTFVITDPATGAFTYTPFANAYGSDSFTFQITDDDNGESNIATVTINIAPVADTPSVTDSTTAMNTLSTEGLVISTNPVDGAEVTHYQISSITAGTLYLADGVTQIDNGDFISRAEAEAGLRFLPAVSSLATGSFQVQASLSGDVGGLGGDLETAQITVVPLTTVEDIEINAGLSGGNQRSMLMNLSITFSGIVTFDSEGFVVQLRQPEGNPPIPVDLVVNSQVIAGKTVVQLTFTGDQTENGSLKDGNYQLIIDGDQVHDALNIDLDGDNNQTAGGDLVFGSGTATAASDKFFRMFGDTDGDRDVDNVDLLRFRRSFDKPSTDAFFAWYCDFNQDNDTDNADLLRFRQRYGKILAEVPV